MDTTDEGGRSHGLTPPSTRRGLCMTCNNAPHCYYRKRRGGDALFCEMFDDSGSYRHHYTSYDDTNDESSNSAPAASARGLCTNCLYRQTCHLPKPESGVWHCELYR